MNAVRKNMKSAQSEHARNIVSHPSLLLIVILQFIPGTCLFSFHGSQPTCIAICVGACKQTLCGCHAEPQRYEPAQTLPLHTHTITMYRDKLEAATNTHVSTTSMHNCPYFNAASTDRCTDMFKIFKICKF